MTKKYGSGRTTKEWAIWPDGSMMRFIPFLLPTSSARSLGKVTSTIKHHIFSKATETYRDLDAVDLFTPKEYLNGKTMQQAILETTSGKLPGMPVFKNITRKWSRNFLETSYQLSSYATLSEEADAAVQGLMSSLQEKYGNESLAHFPEGSLLDSHFYLQNGKDQEAEDPETIQLLEDLDEHTVSNILAPEYITILELEASGLTTDGASTIQLSEEEGDTHQHPQDNKSNKNKSSTNNTEEPSTDLDQSVSGPMDTDSIATDNISILTETSDYTVDEDAITVCTGSSTPEGAKKLKKEWKEAYIINKKLAAIKMTHEEIRTWREKNPLLVETVAALTSTKFKEMIGIIKKITSQKVKENLPKQKEPPGRPEEALEDS